MGSEDKIQCALLNENIESKPKKCVNPKVSCMHRLGKRCNWVEFGDTESFLATRNMTANRFTMECKKGSVRIRMMLIIDNYYEFLKAKHNIYPSLEDNVFTCLEFPFDYPNHYWSKDMIDQTLVESNIEDFSKTLTDKAVELFLGSLNVLKEYFEDDN